MSFFRIAGGKKKPAPKTKNTAQVPIRAPAGSTNKLKLLQQLVYGVNPVQWPNGGSSDEDFAQIVANLTPQYCVTSIVSNQLDDLCTKMGFTRVQFEFKSESDSHHTVRFLPSSAASGNGWKSFESRCNRFWRLNTKRPAKNFIDFSFLITWENQQQVCVSILDTILSFCPNKFNFIVGLVSFGEFIARVQPYVGTDRWNQLRRHLDVTSIIPYNCN